MKFCPFLVAGQSLAAAQPQADSSTSQPAFAAPAVDLILQDLDTSSASAAVGAARTGTTLPVLASGSSPDAPRLGGIECLGETCRFFAAGTCRFDALFESQTRAQSTATLSRSNGDGNATGSGVGATTGA